MKRKEIPIANQIVHLYNRGVNRQPIFFTRENWHFFLRRLRHYCTADQADILAYCLMPNHYHLLVHLHTDTFGADVMQPFIISYTKAINKQQGRVGPLFQGPYQAKRVDNQRYLMHLTRYIHLNPVAARLTDAPQAWPYSSFQEYIGTRSGTLPRPEMVLAQVGGGGGSSSSRNPVFLKNRVSEKVSEKNRVSEMSDAQRAYADFVCSPDDFRAGLTDALLFNDE